MWAENGPEREKKEGEGRFEINGVKGIYWIHTDTGKPVPTFIAHSNVLHDTILSLKGDNIAFSLDSYRLSDKASVWSNPDGWFDFKTNILGAIAERGGALYAMDFITEKGKDSAKKYEALLYAALAVETVGNAGSVYEFINRKYTRGEFMKLTAVASAAASIAFTELELNTFTLAMSEACNLEKNKGVDGVITNVLDLTTNDILIKLLNWENLADVAIRTGLVHAKMGDMVPSDESYIVWGEGHSRSAFMKPSRKVAENPKPWAEWAYAQDIIFNDENGLPPSENASRSAMTMFYMAAARRYDIGVTVQPDKRKTIKQVPGSIKFYDRILPFSTEGMDAVQVKQRLDKIAYDDVMEYRNTGNLDRLMQVSI